jgi:hypothetical protein
VAVSALQRTDAAVGAMGGNHYLFDMIAGAAVAAGSIALVRRMPDRSSAGSLSSDGAMI